MCGLDVVRILVPFSFSHQNTTYPCALVQWYSLVGEECNEDTGIWIVKPDMAHDGSCIMVIIHLDSIFRAAHLLPVFDCLCLLPNITCHNSLDLFTAFYVNKFIDHHAFEIAS
jgi:hypothetical protein